MAMMASGMGPSREEARDDESILGDDLIEADDGESLSNLAIIVEYLV